MQARREFVWPLISFSDTTRPRLVDTFGMPALNRGETSQKSLACPAFGSHNAGGWGFFQLQSLPPT
jgi:hypothetical protein